MTRLGSFPSTLPVFRDAKTRQVEVGSGYHHVMVLLEEGTRSFDEGDVIELTDYEYGLIAPAVFTSGILIERGEIQTVEAASGTDNDIRLVSLPLVLADVAAGVVGSVTPGFAGKIVNVQALVTTPVTTAAKAATLDFKIGTAPVGTNEVQTITVSATGGTFTVTYSGQTTSALAWNVTAAALQAALEALSNIAVGDVVVTGGPGATAPLTITFKGTLAGTNVAAVTTTPSLTGGAGTATVATPTAGTTTTVALTSANCTPEGASVASSGTLTSADAVFDADDEIVVTASSVTAFIEGAVVVLLTTVAS
jgi:ribosomal protein S11